MGRTEQRAARAPDVIDRIGNNCPLMTLRKACRRAE